MAETNPSLNMTLLEASLGGNPKPVANIPNVPFTEPNLPLPKVDGEPTPSAISAIENKVLNAGNDPLQRGGGIDRSLAEVQSDRYDYFVPGDYDNEDAYAQGQGWPAKMVNGIGKGLILTGTTLLQTTVGTVNGLVKMIETGKASSFYDNEMTRTLDRINKYFEDTLPHYYTNRERNARWYSPNKLFTGNFLWDGIVKNLGFAAGAAISGQVYATALRALPLTARLFSVGKSAETLAATEQGLLAANKAADTYGKVKALSDQFLNSYQLLNPVGRKLVAVLATTGEAGIEAYHNLNDFRNQKIAEYMAANGGRYPQGADLDRINQEAENVGNKTFKLNTVLLSATNFIQFPKILGSSYRAERGMINSLKQDIQQVVKDETGRFIRKEASTRAGRLLSSLNTIRPYTFSVSEAFEEGAQYAISIGTEDYYNKRYDDDAASFLGSLITGVEETLTTDEGMQNVLIGGLSGALMQGRGRFLERARKSKNTADAIQKFNQYQLSDFTKETIDAVNRGTAIQKEREALLRQGNILDSKDKERDYIINYLTPRIKYGRYDLVQDDINEAKRLASTEEGFAQLQAEGKALAGDTRSAYLQRLDNLSRTAENMNSLYQSLQLRYGGLVDENNQPVYSSEVMNKMLYAATKVADYDERLVQLSTDLLETGIDTDAVSQGALSGNAEPFNAAVSEIMSRDTDLDTKETIVEQLSDFAELSLRRRRFLEEYNELKRSPEKFKDVEVPDTEETPDEEKPTIKLKTKDGEEELFIGEEYYLGRVVDYSPEGHEIHRFPKLTIIGENEDGTIKIQTSNGNIRDVKKSELEDYKLGRVSDVENNKKAKFFLENANNVFEFNFGKGKKKRGRLEYNNKEGVLNFVYKDDRGKVRKIEVTGDQFVPKKGFNTPLISKVGDITALEQKALNEFATEKDKRIAEKRQARLSIINDLYNELSERQTKVDNLIAKKKSELANIDKELADLRRQIEESPLTPKTRKFKSTTRKALVASSRLVKMKEQLEDEVSSLEAEKDELELQATYVADLSENIDVLPTDSKEFLEELQFQKELLEDTIINSGVQISTLTRLIDETEAAIESAIEFASSLVDEFVKKYPKAPLALGQEWVDFIQANPNFLKLKPNYKEDLKALEDMIAEVEDLEINANIKKLEDLHSQIRSLQEVLSDAETDLKAKQVIIDKFEQVAKLHKEAKAQEEKIRQNTELKKALLGSGDTGVQTKEYGKEYEPQAKKNNIQVVTSTKPATNSQLPHHLRANLFGANWDKLPNRKSIRGVLVTSKNEDMIIPGLTNFLKGDSDADVNKIIALVMVDEEGKPVGVDGQTLENPSTENAIFQVMPDPSLTWSKEFGGGTMFRKETTPEQIEFFKKQYTEWVNNVLENPSLEPHSIVASFGIPEYVTFLNEEGEPQRDYNAVVSVQEAGLINEDQLSEEPVLEVATSEGALEKGGNTYQGPLGRVFLNLPNAYVPLQNRQLLPREANAVYEVIHALSKEVFDKGNAKSPEAKRLIKWLRSIIYWGRPKNANGYNSVFFREDAEGDLELVMGRDEITFPFTPSGIEANKEGILSVLQNLYNNVNTGMINKSEEWNQPYEEILGVKNGEVQTKQWPNYQSYLLSTEGRKKEELPLFTQMKPIEEGKTNRTGIYFTITDTADHYAGVPEAPKQKVLKPIREAKPKPKYVLDGKTKNEFISPSGKKLIFAAVPTVKKEEILKSGSKGIVLLTGGDEAEVIKTLKSKGLNPEVEIKKQIFQAIAPYLKQQVTSETKFQVEEDVELTPEAAAILGFSKETPAEKTPTKQPVVKEENLGIKELEDGSIEITDLDEAEMQAQMANMPDDLVLRVKLKEEGNRFITENWADIEKWLSKNFPNLPVYRVKNIIQATNGLQAWGMFKNGAIYVYENAEVGTIYHEVFEAVWKTFATPTEQAAVKKEFRSRKGSFVDRPTGRTIAYKDASDIEIKEQLAEEFRDYVLNPKPAKTGIAKLFSDIVNFIKTFFTGNRASSNVDALFNKIGTGYYKQYTPHQPKLAFAQKGFIDIDEVYAGIDADLRVALPANITHEIMEQMTYMAFTDLIRDNKSLFGLPKINKKDLYAKLKTGIQSVVLKVRKEQEALVASGDITKEQAQPKINNAIILWKTIGQEWEAIQAKHQEYLKKYNIEFDEYDETIISEDRSKDDTYGSAEKIDNFKKANGAIKLLLSTLPRVTADNKLVYSTIGGAQLLPASEVFVTLWNKLSTSRTPDEMRERLKQLSLSDPNYRTLYNRLTKGSDSWANLTEKHDGQLIAAFWRTFKKQAPDVKSVFVLDNGVIEVGDSNHATAARQIKQEFNNAMVKAVKTNNKFFQYDKEQKAFVGKAIGVKNVKLNNDAERIKFLGDLGIQFKLSDINKLSEDQKQDFRKAVAGIRDSIRDAKRIVSIGGKALDIDGRLLQLSQIKAAIENPEFDTTFFNIDGERVQSFIGTNPISDFHDAISQAEKLEDLENTQYSYLLTDVFAKNSVILNKMFSPKTGKRVKGTENLMKPGWADGTNNAVSGKKKQSSKLNFRERLLQEITLNKKGYYYTLVPGDASLEHMVYMGNSVRSEDITAGYERIHSIFKGYFISELELSREGRKVAKGDPKDLRFFKGILGDKLHNEILKAKGTEEQVYEKYASQINKAVESFIKEEANALQQTLESYNILKQDTEGIRTEGLALTEEQVISTSTLQVELETLTSNYIINNIELHKLLFADPYQYKDELKRIKSAVSPRQAILHSSPTLNSALNKMWNKGFTKEDIGYYDFTKDYFKTATLSDVKGTSNLKDYGVFDETDGGGIISMPAYRAFRIKAGEWNDNEEAQYQYDIAFEKQTKGQKLSKEQEEILKKGNPHVKSAYTPLKPIVFGNKLTDRRYNDIVLDKFALYPLSFRIAYEINPTSNAVKHYNKMQQEGIDYTVFASGRKVGSEGTNNLYNPGGSFNTLPFQATINIPHSIISIQSEVPSKDEPKVTRGSQPTKLVTMDFMEAGVPIDYMQGETFKARFHAWNQLSEEQKLEQSPLYKEIKHNQQLLEDLTEEGYITLLEKLGLRELDNGGYEIVDIDKVATTLKEEVLKREVNDNIIAAFEGFQRGDVVLEATPAYQQIRNVLYSIVDKNVISPKITGGQKVQIPVTLLESVRAQQESNGAYTSDFLRFYEDADGKRTAEVMVGRWFNSKLSDQELLDFLNKTEEGQQILSGVAFRIPTQKQNSIDSIVVKQFLPAEFGDSVVIPSALVKKVGSDFDIDKLFIYLKNVIVDRKGYPKLVQYHGSREATREAYEREYIENIEADIERITKYADFRNTVVQIFETIESVQDRSALTVEGVKFLLGEEMYDFYDKHISLLQEITEQAYEENLLPSDYIKNQIKRLSDKVDELQAKIFNDEQKEKYVKRHIKKALENGYIQSMQNLISHPLNFENLVKPNSAEQLKELARDVTKKRGLEEFNYDDPSSIIKRTSMSRLRHSFVTGKYAIGIAAVNQTNHSLNQRQPIYVDPSKWDTLSQEDQFWLSGGTMRPEDMRVKFSRYNKLEIDGKIVPTLSMVKNAEGENISDIIGQFIDGYVDISKGPWIMELGAAPNVAGVWLFLTKIGVPIKDVAYFMNQPIIVDYLRRIENEGYTWLFIDSILEEVKNTYFSEGSINQQSIPSQHELGKMIGKSPSELTPKQLLQQQMILTEFTKYAKMANHMFLVTQGSNFDTANFNDHYLVFKKFKQLEKARATIISSVDDLIENSFLSRLSAALYDVTNALAEILPSNKPNVRRVIEQVLTPYVDKPDREFVRFAKKAVTDLFDWAVQTDRGINKQVQKILLSENNAASQIEDFVVEVRKNPKHPLYNNIVINSITPHYSDGENQVNNLKIKNKGNKVYDQNQMIYAFEELKAYLGDSPLYGTLVRLSVLQSGLSNSPISFTSMLPYEDFKTIYNKTLTNLEQLPNLQDFVKLNVFERNNWNNREIVPLRKAKGDYNQYGKWEYNKNFWFARNYPAVAKAIEDKKIPQVMKLAETAREADNDVIVYSWEVGTPREKAEKRKNNDFSYIKRGLFKKVYKGNTPFTTSFTVKEGGKTKVVNEFIYKLINAWGESRGKDGSYFSANEFYSEGRPSVIDNGFEKSQEVDDATIISYFEKKQQKQTEEEDSSNEEMPSCI